MYYVSVVAAITNKLTLLILHGWALKILFCNMIEILIDSTVTIN